MFKAIIVGGSKGLGLAILEQLLVKYDEIIVLDIAKPLIDNKKIRYIQFDLSKPYSSIDESLFNDCDTLIITAGIGTVKPFENISEIEIQKLFEVNSVSVTKLIKKFYKHLLSNEDKKCFVMGSIAGEIVSPLFSVYGASKASIYSLCESLNIELEMSGSNNRISYGSATSFEGSSFNGGETNLSALREYAQKCIKAMNDKRTVIYLNGDICNSVKGRYLSDKHEFGVTSFKYKKENNRVLNRKTIVVGYLSGTFDLFHVGHLNLLKRAKEQCDYLIVGVHESGSWKGKETFIPFEERLDIVRSIKYVDEAHPSTPEDSDAWQLYHYDKLFVGSDYKGTERFKKYEECFKDKGVQIVYFPYTKSTSSTQIREKIKNL